MKKLVIFVLLVAFSGLCAADFDQSLSALEKAAVKLKKDGVEHAVHGFINYVKKRLPQESKDWDQVTREFVKNGICEIALNYEAFEKANNLADTGTYLEELLLEFIFTADSVVHKEQKPFSKRLADSAKNAHFHLDKINGNMHIYGMRTWYPGTAVTKTILGITKTFPGWLSCAYTVSAFFKGADKYIGSYGSVTDLTGKLVRMGWKTIYKSSDLETGDVIFWKEGSSRHIGVCTGWGTAVSNSSILGRPTAHSAATDNGGKPMYRAYRSNK